MAGPRQMEHTQLKIDANDG